MMKNNNVENHSKSMSRHLYQKRAINCLYSNDFAFHCLKTVSTYIDTKDYKFFKCIKYTEIYKHI